MVLDIKLAEGPENIDNDTIQEVNINDIACVEIDCLDVRDLIKHEIEELTINESDAASTVYQAHLLVNVDITSDMMAKDVAALIVAEIEGGDDYSWNEILKKIFEAVKTHNINPCFVFMNKDFVEINTTIEICKNNHRWEAVPNSIQQESWEPYCADNIKLTLEDAKQIALSRHWECLSENLELNIPYYYYGFAIEVQEE
ncbi:14712_t:CDS:2 [Cetraspora pellucida]|uniref:14712_t:CDS:1 n=1 Tax=Cetraspora pellucida TaxID=1433469 RepID=A0A9N9GK01_9GLOM|nr:14712_t:CDS:2 [Cetraspora pellucida]